MRRKKRKAAEPNRSLALYLPKEIVDTTKEITNTTIDILMRLNKKMIRKR